MAERNKRGLGSKNMTKEMKDKIHRMGGEASRGGGRRPKDQT